MTERHLLRKYVSPTLPPTVLRREDLIMFLQEAVAYKPKKDGITVRYKLVLLCAPAGYGKTTLLADFASSTPIPCCWHFLDATDKDYVVFLKNLLTSLSSIFPLLGERLLTLLTNLLMKEQSSFMDICQPIIDILCADLTHDMSEPFAFILCNYEEINENTILNSIMDYLLEKLPPKITIFIESRTMLNISFIPLLIENQMCGLNNDALRFSIQEVSELVKLLGLTTITEFEVEGLTCDFDGWITGMLLGTSLGDLKCFSSLQRMTSSKNKTSSQMSYVAQQKRKNLFVYVADEVFKHHMEAYTFIREASILQQMEPEICNMLLEINNAAQLLAYLEQQGLFVTLIEQNCQMIYTCHSVLRNLFNEQMRDQEQKRFITLHYRAAQLWQDQKNYDQAFYHGCKAGTHDLVVQVILNASKQYLQQGKVETLIQWIQVLPSTILENHPQLLLIQATDLLTRGEISATFITLDKVSLLLAGISETDDLPKIQILQVEMKLLRSKALFQIGDYPQTQALCLQVLMQLPNNEIELRAIAEMRVGICMSLQGDFTSGILHLQQALHIGTNTLQTKQEADIHAALANIYYLIGNFMLAEHYLAHALKCCNQIGDEQSKVDNLIRKGLIYLHQGIYPEAEESMHQALNLSRTLLQTQRGEAYALINLGSLYMEQGIYEQALSFYESGLRLAERWGNRSLINVTLCNIAMIYLLVGEPISARIFIDKANIQVSDGKFMNYEQIWYELTYGMIFLYQGCYDEAYTHLVKVEANLNNTGLKRGQLQAKLRLAACQIARGQQREAAQIIEEVTYFLVNHNCYKQLVRIELKWLPMLLQAVKSLQRYAHLRELLGLEADYQRESSQLSSPGVKSSLAKITIQALGKAEVLLDDNPIKCWRMAHSMELFFFLLAAHKPLSKEQIITALWPEFDDLVNQTFHSTLHYLRKLLGKDSILFEAGSYSLNLTATHGSNIWYDVEEFQLQFVEANQAKTRNDPIAAREAFLRMVELYKGDYGQTFYNDWCLLLRDDLRTAYLEALQQLADFAWHNRAFDESIHHWRSMLSVDNSLEEAHFGIMRSYVYQGKRSAALRQYKQCQGILLRDLNVQPGRAIQNLYQRLAGSTNSS